MAPVMRRLLQSNIKTHLIVSGVLCTISMIATKILINDPRKAKYAEFYKYVYHFQQQFDAKNWVANLILF
jgi:Cytochrome c oxidase subunit VIc